MPDPVDLTGEQAAVAYTRISLDTAAALTALKVTLRAGASALVTFQDSSEASAAGYVAYTGQTHGSVISKATAFPVLQNGGQRVTQQDSGTTVFYVAGPQSGFCYLEISR